MEIVIANFSIRKFQKHLVVLLISLLIGGLTAAYAGQDLNFDLLNYHFSNPHALLHNRVDYDIAAAQLETYGNPVIDVPGYVLIRELSPRKAATALGVIQGINIWIIFEIVLLLLKRLKTKDTVKVLLALFIAVLSFFSAANLSEVGNTMGDNISSILVLSALWCLLYSVVMPEPARSARLRRLAAYFLAGTAVGLKLTTAVYAVGLLAAGLALGGSWMQKLKASVVHGGAVLAGVLVASGFWYLKIWGLFKNPIFPFYNDVFDSPYYPSVNFVDVRWIPTSIGRAFLAPFYYAHEQAISSEIPFRDPRLAVVYGLLVVLVIFLALNKFVFKKRHILPRWPKEYTIFWIFFIVAYVVWTKQFSYYRYLIPLELLSLTAITTLLYVLIKKFALATAALVLIIAITTTLTIPINWGRIPWQPTYFGVTEADFKQLQDSTILIAGYAPLGFLVPYFPESSRTIRLESDLSSPTKGTAAMQERIRSAVNQRLQERTKFFGLRADEEQAQAEATFNHFGFKTGDCTELPVYARQNSPSKFRLCSLAEVK